MRQLNGPIDVDFINKTFFPNDKDVKDINRGRCFLWAYIAHNLYIETNIWDIGSHVFVRHNNKFYDAETPNGVEDYRKLPTIEFGARCSCPECKRPAAPIRMDVFYSDSGWGKSAHKYKIVWSEVRNQVQKVVQDALQIRINQ